MKSSQNDLDNPLPPPLWCPPEHGEDLPIMIIYRGENIHLSGEGVDDGGGGRGDDYQVGCSLLFVCLSFLVGFVMFVCFFVCLFVCSLVCLFVRSFACSLVCLCVRMFACLSMCQNVKSFPDGPTSTQAEGP